MKDHEPYLNAQSQRKLQSKHSIIIYNIFSNLKHSVFTFGWPHDRDTRCIAPQVPLSIKQIWALQAMIFTDCGATEFVVFNLFYRVCAGKYLTWCLFGAKITPLFMQISMRGYQLSVIQQSWAVVPLEGDMNALAFFSLCWFQTSGWNSTCKRAGFENQRGGY